MVFNQKYGDCKINHTCWPFYSTRLVFKVTLHWYQRSTGKLLIMSWPALRIRSLHRPFHPRDSTYWIDPTLNARWGRLKMIPSRNMIVPWLSIPQTMDWTVFHSVLRIQDNRLEEYSMSRIGGPVTLKVLNGVLGHGGGWDQILYSKQHEEKIKRIIWTSTRKTTQTFSSTNMWICRRHGCQRDHLHGRISSQ